MIPERHRALAVIEMAQHGFGFRSRPVNRWHMRGDASKLDAESLVLLDVL